MKVSRLLKLFSLTQRLSLCNHNSFLPRARTFVSGLCSSEVLHSPCGRQFRTLRAARKSHSILVSAGERQPAGDPQYGSGSFEFNHFSVILKKVILMCEKDASKRQVCSPEGEQTLLTFYIVHFHN